MSDFLPAYNFMMDNEDGARAYKQVPDVGGSAISGINSHDYPTEFAAIAAIPQSERGLEVEKFYRASFWNKWFEQLPSQDLANRVFDASVNMGPGTAVRLLQEAVNNFRKVLPSITVDGAWGPITIDVVNNCWTEKFVISFQQVRAAYYLRIVDADPSKARYLHAWLARASK